MAPPNAIAQGREHFTRQEWGNAFVRLSEGDAQGALEPDDLDRLATACYLTGGEDWVDLWTRAHHGFLDHDEASRAALCAFWLGVTLMLRGEAAPAGGWLARAGRLVEEHKLDGPEPGYLLVPSALHNLEEDPEASLEGFKEATEIGLRFMDSDLRALGQLGQGQALTKLQRTEEAMASLDEAMVSVVAGEVTSIPSGIIYCAVILACRDAFDVRRAHEWTEALNRWCDSQPDLVLYRGQCLTHRSEIMQLRGAWTQALSEVQQACERLSNPPWQPAIGAAYNQQGELHRLKGEFSKADAAYSNASQWGYEPQPGMALMRLAEGKADKAAAAIRRVLDQASDPVVRPKMLAAFVEIMLAAKDVESARGAADELVDVASSVDTPLVRAMSSQARGAVLLASGEAKEACHVLRQAWASWQELEAPYEVARVRVLLGLATLSLGDRDGARMEFEAGRRTFEELGAGPDLRRVVQLMDKSPAKAAGGLSSREVEVLRLVAEGKTNRAIAAELVISEKTVARHMSNIFNKLGVSSRAAATAYAYEHDLV